MGLNKAASIAATLVLAGWIAATGVAGADPSPSDPSPTPAPAEGQAPGPAPAAGPAAKTTIDGDGTFKVGTDIAPGTYASAGPVDGRVCYWKRTASADAGGHTIDNAMSKKPQVVSIDPTDAAFKTDGCQPWSLTDAAPDSQPSGLLPGLLGKAQLAGIMADLNNRAAQAPPAADPAPAP
jgi:hypothetical protein